MNNPDKRILCSTGTMVGRENGFDLRRAVGVIADLREKNLVLGGEFMMLPYYYDRQGEVVELVKSSGVPFPVIHCEKGVGTSLSDCALMASEGKTDDASRLLEETLDVFRLNCSFAEDLSSRKMVLHLWGGRASDSHVEYNISALPRLVDIAREHGVKLLIENVPSTTHDPLSNWLSVCASNDDIGLIFDTRFATLHDQLEATLKNDVVRGRLSHVHVSDFVGGYRNFYALRPILHPTEGVVDFGLCASLLSEINYDGTITLESPVMVGADIDVAKLAASIRFIGDFF